MRSSSVSVVEMPVVSLSHPCQPAFAEPEELQYVWEKCRTHAGIPVGVRDCSVL